MLTGDLLDRVRDGLVVVGQHPAGDVVGVAARGLLAPGPGETALGQRAPRDRSDALVGQQAEHLALFLALQAGTDPGRRPGQRDRLRPLTPLGKTRGQDRQ